MGIEGPRTRFSSLGEGGRLVVNQDWFAPAECERCSRRDLNPRWRVSLAPRRAPRRPSILDRTRLREHRDEPVAKPATLPARYGAFVSEERAEDGFLDFRAGSGGGVVSRA